jgi:glucosamine--fructose-6-phosphate aminotransferase (isomerizing)
MCGIIGYVGNGNAVPFVREGLKKLEYRGYDSCGIAVKTNGILSVIKDKGKIADVLDSVEVRKLSGTVAIGHTRWATHGAVNQANAHPHLSNSGEIAVVHNGILENYQALRQFLEEKGFTLKSQTDTEVIPNLIEFYMREGKGFAAAVQETLGRLEGSYAVLVMKKGTEALIAARKESPLVLGIGAEGYLAASDIPAFLDHTKKVIYLSDFDMAVMRIPEESSTRVSETHAVLNKDLKIYNVRTGLPVERKISTVEWSAEQARKGNFEHFMLKEISEQAETLGKAIEQDSSSIEEIVKAIKAAKGIYFVACGSSYHACIAASYKFSKLAKKHINICLASEFPNFEHFLIPESLVIAISQSGETADVLAAVKAAKSKKAKVISIVNAMGSTLARESDTTVLMNAGPEICVLSTKTYTSQLAILTLIAYALAGRYGEGKGMLKELIRHIYYLTAESTRQYLKDLAVRLKDAQHIYTIGRGLQYGTALEAALKIKEVSYIHAEGFAGGELKHGSIALIEQGTPCIVFTSTDTEKEMIGNAMELKARGAYIIGVGPNGNEAFDTFIKVREAEEANSICQIIPIQILAYQLALLRGCDPDMPRNLAKSVTVK